MEFEELPRSTVLRPGVVLKGLSTDHPESLLRITHVFDAWVYAIPVSTPQAAHDAHRPARFHRHEIEQALETPAHCATLGRIPLPGELAVALSPSDKRRVDALFNVIEPLLLQFEVRHELTRRFAERVAQRATDLGMSTTTVRRLLLRYWYFGGVKAALLPLVPGVTASASVPTPTGEGFLPGPISRIEKERGARNTFRPTEQDVAEMVAALKRLAGKSKTTIKAARLEYLGVEFKARHPESFRLWQEKRIAPPISYRRYYRIIKQHEELTAQLRGNVRGLADRESSRGARARGPGEIYELDATGGQIVLISRNNPSLKLLVYIYLLIDQWSRFIVSVYASLTPPSSKNVRHALRIAILPREGRFESLGYVRCVERWQQGVVPVGMSIDRGSDMLAYETLFQAVDTLRIEPLVLPPQTPDGKAIIERCIRSIKDELRHRGTAGTFPKFVMSPKDKSRKRQASAVAVHDLRSAYGELLRIVDEHNHGPHSALQKRGELLAADVQPTPAAAYRWGLEHITGIATPPLTREDVERLTLVAEIATPVGRTLHRRGHRYFPANAEARQASMSTSKKPVPISVDDAFPVRLYSGRRRTAIWEIDEEGKRFYDALTAEEEVELHEAHRLNADQARDSSDAERAAGVGRKKVRTPRPSSTSDSGQSANGVRRGETRDLNAEIAGAGRQRRGVSDREQGIEELLKVAQTLDDAELAQSIQNADKRRSR